jgi:hypothetical protein
MNSFAILLENAQDINGNYPGVFDAAKWFLEAAKKGYHAAAVGAPRCLHTGCYHHMADACFCQPVESLYHMI